MVQMDKVRLMAICSAKQWATVSMAELLDSGYPVYGANGQIGFYKIYNHVESTLMITCRGATCGEINISKPFSYINGNAMSLDDLSKDFSVKFLFYFLKNFNFKNIISGSAQPQITKQGLQKILIPIISPTIQQKIVAELDSLSDIIEKKKEQLKELDNLSQSLFHEMFGDIERNEKGWKASTLYDACDSLMAGGDVPQKSCSKVKTMDYNIPILTNGEKNNGLYGYTDVVKVNKPCVTISARGTIGYAVVRKEPFYPAVRLIVVIPKSEFLNLVYLQMVLNIFSKPTGQGVSIPQLTIPTIKNKKILLPPMELQNEFANRVEEIEKQKDLINKSLVEVQTLFDSRMQKYFGE